MSRSESSTALHSKLLSRVRRPRWIAVICTAVLLAGWAILHRIRASGYAEDHEHKFAALCDSMRGYLSQEDLDFIATLEDRDAAPIYAEIIRVSRGLKFPADKDEEVYKLLHEAARCRRLVLNPTVPGELDLRALLELSRRRAGVMAAKSNPSNVIAQSGSRDLLAMLYHADENRDSPGVEHLAELFLLYYQTLLSSPPGLDLKGLGYDPSDLALRLLQWQKQFDDIRFNRMPQTPQPTDVPVV